MVEISEFSLRSSLRSFNLGSGSFSCGAYPGWHAIAMRSCAHRYPALPPHSLQCSAPSWPASDRLKKRSCAARFRTPRRFFVVLAHFAFQNGNNFPQGLVRATRV